MGSSNSYGERNDKSSDEVPRYLRFGSLLLINPPTAPIASSITEGPPVLLLLAGSSVGGYIVEAVRIASYSTAEVDKVTYTE